MRVQRQRKLEGLPADLAGRADGQHAADQEQLTALHDEIQRLPEKYRLPIVLCCIETLSHEEAARQLNWPLGTVHGRLSRGRELLGRRLGRRGLVIPMAIARTRAGESRTRDIAVRESLLQSTVSLLGNSLPTKLQGLVKGVLSAMLIEKVRSTAFVAAMTTLGVASAATALMAFQEPATKSGRASAIQKAQGPSAKVTPNDVMKVAGNPLGAAAADEAEEERLAAEEERLAEEVGKMRARVEMLELKSESLRRRIHEAISQVDQYEDSLHDEKPPGLNPEQRERQQKTLASRIEKKKELIAQWQDEYSRSRVDIARLNYRIARTPRSIYESERDDSGKSIYDLLRRVDRLEAKVDRLADSVAKVKAP
jgi:hypothetical protein